MGRQTYISIWERNIIHYLFAFKNPNLNIFLIWFYFVVVPSLVVLMEFVLMHKSVGDSHLIFFHYIFFVDYGRNWIASVTLMKVIFGIWTWI